MFSIRSIFTAAVALATLASAIPLSPDNLTPPGSGDITGTDPASSLSGGLPLGAITGAIPGSSVSSGASSPLGNLPLKRGGVQTPGDLIKSCQGTVEPLVIKIKAIVAVEGFDHKQVTSLVGEIIVALQFVIAQLKLTVAAKLTAEVLLTIDGVVCTVADLGAVVYGLLELVLVVVALVLRLVVTVDVTLAVLLRSLGPLVVEILTIVVGLVAGLDVIIRGLLEAVVIADIKLIGCTEILALVGLAIS